MLNTVEVRYRVEYRTMTSDVLFLKESTEDDKKFTVHEGPVFDVVTVNYTLETKDTQTDKSDSDKAGTIGSKSDVYSRKPPTVEHRGRNYVRIYSKAIINALQSVVNYYPVHDLVSQPLDINWPYAIVVHHWAQLEQFISSFNSSGPEGDFTNCSVGDTRRHLRLLLDFVDKEIGDQVRKEQERWSRDPPVASFDMLWLLLKPGTDVYEHMDDYDCKEPFVISRVGFTPMDGAWVSYNVDQWCFDNDTTSHRPVLVDRIISLFHGERPIKDIKIFPCEYHPEHTARRQELIARGRLFTSLQQKKCMYFDGATMNIPKQDVRQIRDPRIALTHDSTEGTSSWIQSWLLRLCLERTRGRTIRSNLNLLAYRCALVKDVSQLNAKETNLRDSKDTEELRLTVFPA